MTDFPRPVVVVSKCLGFDHCRYNGQVIPDPFVEKLKEFVTFIPVCPEVEIGLGVPRDPIRIVMENGTPVLYQPATGKRLTDEMHAFTDRFLGNLHTVDGFLLKNRSPSCGIGDVKIFNGFGEKAASKRGNGFWGDAVRQRFSDHAIEDEGRLRNFTLREHFLIQLFVFARFREVRRSGTIEALTGFQARHKLLFLAYNQSRYRICGRIAANRERKPPDRVIHDYAEEMRRIILKPPNYPAIINTLHHAFGGYSRNLSKEERQFFLNTVEAYRDERIPLSTVVHLVKSHAVRFNITYLLDQVFLNPYPKSLIEITDSGKGRQF